MAQGLQNSNKDGTSVDPAILPSLKSIQRETSADESDKCDNDDIYVNMVDDHLGPLTVSVNGKIQELSEETNTRHSPDEGVLAESNEGHTDQLREALRTIAAENQETAKSDLKINISDSHLLLPTTADAFLQYALSSTEEKEFTFSRGELRKSSSLKTNKTPPGTPSRKKVVRFADAMGLDLESVRNIVNMDTPPKVPASALADLRTGLEQDRLSMGSRYLTACFPQPGASENFIQLVLSQKVCLENAVVTGLTITGVIRVSNISFNKVVRVRYSTNNWTTFHDISASYIQQSCDGPTDRFSFSIVAPATFNVGSQLQFAISFSANGIIYWDNNNNDNYTFECFAKTVPTEAENSWMHFL